MNHLTKKISFFIAITSLGLLLAGCTPPTTDQANEVGQTEDMGQADGNTQIVVEKDETAKTQDTNIEEPDQVVNKGQRDLTPHTLANDLAAKADIVVDIVGTNFSFSPSRIEVKKGDVVTINFSSELGFHDRVLDGTEDIATEQINPGETTSVTFIAGSPGEYVFYCSVGNHREQGMVGRLVVSGT